MTPLALLGALLLQLGGAPAWSDAAATNPAGGQAATAVSDRGPAPAGDQRLQELDRLIRDGHFPAAQDLARATLSQLDREGEGNSPIAAQVIDHLLVASWRSGDVGSDEALTLARRLVAQQEARFGRASPEAAASLISLGRTHVLRDEKQEADRVLLEALELSRESLGSRHPQVAECQYWLGLSDLFNGRYAPARAWLEQALAIREQAFGVDSVPVALAMTRIGDCVARTGNMKVAIPMLRRAADIVRRQVAPDHPDQFLVLMTLAMHLRNDGEYTESASYIERVVQISEERFGPDGSLTAVYVGLLGDTYAEMGRYAHAQRLYERSIETLLESTEPDRALVLATRGSIGMLLVEMHFYERAIEQLRTAEQGYLELQGEWSDELGNLFSAEADALGALGRYHEAETRLARARQIFEKNFGPDSPNIAKPLNRLAQLRIEQGDPVTAKALAEQAMRILAKAPEHNRASLDQTIAVLAAAHRDLGNYAEALALSERRLQGAREVYGSAHPRAADALIEHAALLAEMGSRSAATQYAIAGEGTSRDNLVLIARSSAEPEAVAYAAHRESAVDLLVTMAGEGRDQDGLIAAAAGDSLVRARALVLDEMAARRRSALVTGDAEIERLLDDLQQASDRLSNLIVRGPREGDRPGYPDALEAARREKQRAERALAARSEDFQRTLMRSSIGLEAVRSALPPHAALVSFVRYNLLDIAPRQAGGATQRRVSIPSYAALVIPPDGGQPSFLRLGNAASIDGAVTALRENVLNEGLAGSSRSDEPGYRVQAARLRQAIWDPLLPLLAGASLVFVAPDGALNLVNLAALPVGTTEYLVEHAPTLHYLSAERDLRTDGMVSGVQGGLLAVSDADFEGQRVLVAAERQVSPAIGSNGPAWGQSFRGQRSACGSFRAMRFKPLPASGREAREIAGMWERGAASTPLGIDEKRNGSDIVMLTGPAARESAFKRNAHGHQVLHLATHGFFLGGQCGSILDPSTAASDASAAASVTRENPLLLSGLAFAGANRRESAGPDEDDGIMTAEEVAALDLHGTEWAVLSACDTGVGEIRSGEGVFGLRRAFQMAGARSVIMSLWPVDDESSRNWMTRLYQRRFVEGSSTAEAVSGTTLEALQQRRRRGESTHPFHWAGFIAAGDWR